MEKKVHRDASSGEYVTAEYAAENPDTTVAEERPRKMKFFFGSISSVVISAQNSREASRLYAEHLCKTNVQVNTDLGGNYEFRVRDAIKEDK